MNKQTLKRYYKNASSNLINSYVIINDKLYITNGVSIISPKQTLSNWIKMDSLKYSIAKYVDNFKKYNFRALDLDNYKETCDLIGFVKNKQYIKENEHHNIGGKYSVNLKTLKTACELIHADTACVMDSPVKTGHPIIFFKNNRTGSHGWMLPSRVY